MAFPSDLVRTKNWGTEVLTDSDLEGQFDLIINWVMAALNATTGHAHDGTSNQGPLLSSSAVTTTFGNGFTTVSAASGDYVLIATDVSDSNKTKKALVSDIVTLAAPTAAAQSDQETATSTTLMVTPGRQQFHPSAVKAWANFNGTGTPAVTSSYNIDSSITDNGTGDWTLSITTDFSATNAYAITGCCINSGASTPCFVTIKNGTTLAAGSVNVQVWRSDTAALQDVTTICVAMYGDQP